MAPAVDKNSHLVESCSSQPHIVVQSNNSTKDIQAETQIESESATMIPHKETKSSTKQCHKDSSQTGDSVLPCKDHPSIREEAEKQKLGTVGAKQATKEHNDSMKPQEESSSSSISGSDDESEAASSEGESTKALSTETLNGQGIQKEVQQASANKQAKIDESAGDSVHGSAKKALTRITVDRGSGGKISVMMGPRLKSKKKLWTPKTVVVGAKDEGFDLLGNLRVSKWDEADITQNNTKEAVTGVNVERANIIKQINRVEKKRKQKMFLDRHDTMLDQGKVS
jgi:hypothetical protein